MSLTRILHPGCASVVESSLVTWWNLHLLVYQPYLQRFRAARQVVSLFSTILAWKRERCSLSRPNRAGCGVMAWVSTILAYPNRISGLRNHYLVGSDLTGSLSWVGHD